MSEESKSMDGTEWGLLVLLSVLWGGAFFFAGVALKELPPLIIVFARVTLAALFLLPLLWFYGHKLPSTIHGWMPFFVMGLVNNVVPFYFQFAALTIITVGLISIINALAPLFTVIILASFGDEKLTLYRIIGVVLGILGVAVLRGSKDLWMAHKRSELALVSLPRSVTDLPPCGDAVTSETSRHSNRRPVS
jgi:drug/metabolite transporter (DMT)-like permease